MMYVLILFIGSTYVLLFAWFWLVNIGILPNHALSYLQWSNSQSDWRIYLYFVDIKTKMKLFYSRFFLRKKSLCINFFQFDWLFFKVSKCQKFKKRWSDMPFVFCTDFILFKNISTVLCKYFYNQQILTMTWSKS